MPLAITDAVRSERRAFIETLRSLDDDQWHVRSLCADWRVIDVAAHLAWAPVLGPTAGATALARHRFSLNRMIARTAIGWSERGRDAILAQLEHNLVADAKPMGMPRVAALSDAVVHGLDVRRPLGLARRVPPEVLGPVADLALGTPWPVNLVVGGSAKRRLAGVRLVATDADWAYGQGPEVHTSSEAVILLLHGRPPARAELSGPGSGLLADRLG